MRSTPRRFRAAAWIAFSALQPAQAMVKVDPLKLRLGSFQRELSDQAMLAALENVMVSGASRGGVDVNSATTAWLERLPGVTRAVAQAIEARRVTELFKSRDELLTLLPWASPVHARQAMPFLRVFASGEVLDGTLIHPDDYPIAKKLASALSIELPPDRPPGYTLPNYAAPKPLAVEPPLAVELIEGAADDEVSEPEPEGLVAETLVAETLVAEAVTAEATESVAEELPSADLLSEGEIQPAAETQPAAEIQPEAESTPADAKPAIVEPVAVRRTRPEQPKIDKLIKEWQIGSARANQIVDWLCEPFGEGSVGGPPAAVMTAMPSMVGLKQGDPVTGVVVGVMPFGVFVELSPECSGLVHVSRISAGFVEDLHEAVQVGDVVTAWVTGTDDKRKRVALSAISPAREEELRQQRASAPARDDISRRDRGGRGPRPPRGGERAEGGQRTEGQAARPPRDPATAGTARSGDNRGQTGNRGGGAPGGGDRSRGGGDRGGKPGGRDGGRSRDGGGKGGRFDSRGGGGRGRQPEVYQVIGKEPEKAPLTEAMAKGDEPLRSFGDLMRLFNPEKDVKVTPAAKPPKEKKQRDKPAASDDVAATGEPAAALVVENSVVENSVVENSVVEKPVVEKPVVATESPTVASSDSSSAPSASGESDAT